MKKMQEIKTKICNAIENLLMTRTLKYDIDGINELKEIIKYTLNGIEFIIHMNTSIPILSYIKNRNNLSKFDNAFLEKSIQFGLIPDVEIRYAYKGNIEVINFHIEIEMKENHCEIDYWEID